MLYLCQNHVKRITADPILAITLWHQAMEGGEYALNKNDWTAARSFYGAAFETAALLLQKNKLNSEFSLYHLIEAANQLSYVLKHLELWEETQLCLFTLQNKLLTVPTPDKDNSTAIKIIFETERFVQSLLTRFENKQNNPELNETPSDPQTAVPITACAENPLSSDEKVGNALKLMTQFVIQPNQTNLEKVRSIIDGLSESPHPKETKNTYLWLKYQWQQIKSAKFSVNSHSSTQMIRPQYLH